MDAREERRAKNEAVYRASNRVIEQAAEDAGDGKDSPLQVLCECGRDDCDAVLTLTIRDYDDVHRQRDRFVVTPEHVDRELEGVVSEGDGFVVVDKFGAAERASEEEEDRLGTT